MLEFANGYNYLGWSVFGISIAAAFWGYYQVKTFLTLQRREQELRFINNFLLRSIRENWEDD